jgi:single-strand DNA-binding protein
MNDVEITLSGNLVEKPVLRYTQANAAVCEFRVASTPRRLNTSTNTWEDGEPVYMRCTAWRQIGENVAASLDKGSRVIVTGKLQSNSYKDKDGNNKLGQLSMTVDEVGASLRNATVAITKSNASSAGSNANAGVATGAQNAGQAPVANNPFASDVPAAVAQGNPFEGVAPSANASTDSPFDSAPSAPTTDGATTDDPYAINNVPASAENSNQDLPF